MLEEGSRRVKATAREMRRGKELFHAAFTNKTGTEVVLTSLPAHLQFILGDGD
jgi:hypothetical protein